MIYTRYILCLIVCLNLISCDFIQDKLGNSSSDEQTDRDIIARVNGRTLYLDQISNNIPEALSAKDSTQYVRHYADRWMRRQIQLREAENYMDPNVDLEKLIEDYRESLILQSYESKFIQRELNKTVRPIEIENYYNAHLEDFALDEPLVRGLFLKLSGPRRQYDVVQKQWKINTDNVDLSEIISDQILANYQQLDTWIPVSEWLDQIPSSVLDSKGVRKNRFMAKEHDNNSYFIRIDEVLEITDTAPLEIVKEEIRALILHKRKLQLLNDNRESLFNKAIQNNIAEIFI